jgi:hypothetical protein
VSLRVNPQRAALFILEETGLGLVELFPVQTVKAGPPLVSTDPFASMVPIKRGFFIGDPEGIPFRSVPNHWLIGSGRPICQEA